ncbi:MAG: stage II sporulation protein M [Lachnospiraceae bacterium]|nr:stage II sporulation protein M [Lachnospiraceae bacterium]
MKKGTYLFFVSFMAGVLMANFLGIASGRDTGAMGEYYINRYLYTDISGRELFVYLFYERVPRAFLLFLLSAGIGVWMIYGYVLYLGITIGMLSVISIINYGVKGVLLMSAFLFPQWICYIPVLFVWYGFLGERRRVRRELYAGDRKMGKKAEWLVFAAGGMVLLICGIFLESYINPYILRSVIRGI